jgi:hypothetical protein
MSPTCTKLPAVFFVGTRGRRYPPADSGPWTPPPRHRGGRAGGTAPIALRFRCGADGSRRRCLSAYRSAAASGTQFPRLGQRLDRPGHYAPFGAPGTRKFKGDPMERGQMIAWADRDMQAISAAHTAVVACDFQHSSPIDPHTPWTLKTRSTPGRTTRDSQPRIAMGLV